MSFGFTEALRGHGLCGIVPSLKKDSIAPGEGFADGLSVAGILSPLPDQLVLLNLVDDDALDHLAVNHGGPAAGQRLAPQQPDADVRRLADRPLEVVNAARLRDRHRPLVAGAVAVVSLALVGARNVQG